VNGGQSSAVEVAPQVVSAACWVIDEFEAADRWFSTQVLSRFLSIDESDEQQQKQSFKKS
jgi:hypothetical protein